MYFEIATKNVFNLHKWFSYVENFWNCFIKRRPQMAKLAETQSSNYRKSSLKVLKFLSSQMARMLPSNSYSCQKGAFKLTKLPKR